MRVTALFALALILSGCRSPVYLGGEYRSRSDADVVQTSQMTLIEDDAWTFFWGLIDTGTVDVHDALNRKLHPNECFTDLEVREGATIDGIIIGYITAGIVSHREVYVRGKRAVRRSETWEKTPSSEKPSPD